VSGTRGLAVNGTVSAVVPTLGGSPHLAACLEALRADGGAGLEIVVVAQGGWRAPAELRRRADRWIELEENHGFTGGTNAGIEKASGAWIATVNDDAVVQPGWLAALVGALEADPEAAAAQGVNLRLAEPGLVDGAGLEWNRWWQAVQVGHGAQTGEGGDGTAGAREVFGVSATAAVYRREALAAVGLFDEGLGSWYEDVDLAVRLRSAGWRALVVPAARALHAGGASGRRMPWRYGALLYGNRWLVAARLLGRRFPAAVPRLLARDLLDLVRRPSLLFAVKGGWLRALRHLPAWCHRGEPLVDPGELTPR
jgi:GT2 family glycosyltransferase